MEPAPSLLNPASTGTNAERGFKKAILRLVKGAPERLAIEAGQIDAIIDPASGNAILLPEAQRALIERKVGFRSPTLDSNRLAEAILDELGVALAVLDQAGVVLCTNQTWRAIAAPRPGMGGGVQQGSNYLAVCDDACTNERVDGMAIAAGIRQVIDAERTLFCYAFCDSAARQRWFAIRVTGIAVDGAPRAIVTSEDITERRRGELLLELERRVLGCLADAADATDAVKSVIRAACETLGWNCGRYFTLDRLAGVLRFKESWGMPLDAVEQFLEKSRSLVFRNGAGLAGRVCQSGQPLWVLAGTRDAGVSSTALAPETGGEDALVFPVTSKDAIIGVLAFSGSILLEPDDRVLQTVQSIGNQLGRFLQRDQTLDALRRSESHMRGLSDLASDWRWEQDCLFRFTQIVGCHPFGNVNFLGMKFWELPNVVKTDETWEEHRSKLAANWTFCDQEFATVLGDGQRGYYSICGEPVYDDKGMFAGYRGTGLNITMRKRAEIALRALAGLSAD